MARALIGSGGIGLSDSEVATLRAALAGNRRPRVVLPGTQFGEGARGQVIAVGDPAAHGDEFIKVRVKLGGVSDTLTFSPANSVFRARARQNQPRRSVRWISAVRWITATSGRRQ